MDLPAEFYLQTIEHRVPGARAAQGHDDASRHARRLPAIRDTALMTVEGERDDICGLGQTEAAHDLCTDIPRATKLHYVQEGVGHYGVFNGTRWRTEIQPRIREFIRTTQFRRRIASSRSRVH